MVSKTPGVVTGQTERVPYCLLLGSGEIRASWLDEAGGNMRMLDGKSERESVAGKGNTNRKTVQANCG